MTIVNFKLNKNSYPYKMQFNIEKYYLDAPAFFKFLKDDELDAVKKSMVSREIAKGEFLFQEGTTAKAIYVIQKGKVKIFQVSREGKESIISIYKSGDFFGYRLLLADDPVPLSAKAIENTVVWVFPGKLFFNLLDTSASFTKKLIVHLSKEFTAWVNKVALFSQYGVRERVAMSLLILERVYSTGRDLNQPVISITRDDLAAYVGTAKETLVRMLRQFKDEEIIRTKGSRIMIHNRGALMEMVSEM